MGLLDKIIAKLAKKKIKKALANPKELKDKVEEALVKVLKKVDESEKVDELETKLIIAGIKAAQSYFGVEVLNDEARQVVAEKVVECLGKINNKVVDRLEK